jgi:DNA repair protein RecO (recombination protein O)
LAHSYYTITTDIIKSTLVIFLSEILHHAIKEEEKNQNLFSFLETALLWLDAHDEVTNFHLILMTEITKYLGFYPDDSEIEFPFFDSKEGFFTPFQNVYTLSDHETHLFKRLLQLKFDSDQKVFAGLERQILLKILLDYYTLHLEGFKKPKSLEVLKEVFS